MRWALEAPAVHVFAQPSLARAWIETYRPLRNIQPRFIIASREGCEVFLPLVLWRRNWKNGWVRVLLPLGHGDFDYHDPLVVGKWNNSEQTLYWKEIVNHIGTRFGREFDRLEISGIHGQGNADGWIASDTCPYCDLLPFSDLAGFLSTVHKSLRNDLSRQQRRLSARGAVRMHIYHNSDTAGILCALETFLKHHNRRWPNAYKAPHLHMNLVKRTAVENILHFSELRLDEKAISWHLGFVSRETFYYYMPAYDVDYRDFSPGKIHLLYCVGDALSRGLSSFDHLRGEENYKNGWATQVDRLHSLTLQGGAFGSSLRSMVQSVRAYGFPCIQC